MSGAFDHLPSEVELGTEERRGWHMDRGINPAYIALLLSVIIGILGWANTINSSQAVQDQKIQTVEKKVDDQILVSREDMKIINAKLDRLIERGSK